MHAILSRTSLDLFDVAAQMGELHILPGTCYWCHPLCVLLSSFFILVVEGKKAIKQFNDGLRIAHV